VADDRKGECQGNADRCTLGAACPKFGLLGRVSRDGKRRVKGCGDPVARGKRNRSKGDSKARRARKMLGIAGANTRHEELWGGALRVEVKAGAQIEPIATRFRAAEAQSQAQRAIGDHRAFVLVAMPDGESDGLCVLRLSNMSQIMELLRETGHL
jgi:hypothetical protein